LTGEEFPADDLGARAFGDWLLETKQSVAGICLLDMIGFNAKGDNSFQLNPGDSKGSMRLAAIARDAAKDVTTSSPIFGIGIARQATATTPMPSFPRPWNRDASFQRAHEPVLY